MRRVALGLAASMLGTLLACNADEPQLATPPPVEHAAQPIIGGTPDTTNEATVALAPSMSNAICSGTIIAVSGSTGYVLTAAHCIEGDPHTAGFPNNPPPAIAFVLQADDYSNCFQAGDPALCGGIYPVTNAQVDPLFPTAVIPMTQSITDDFAIITFSGATAMTPVVPAAGNDGLSVGENLDLSGYGLTSFPSGFTTQRRHVTLPVDQLAGLQIGFDSSNGKGSCNGDSGGPAYKLVGGQLQVVGVTSFGDAGCSQYDVYGRVDGAYNAFIAPIIGAPIVQTCDSCTLAALDMGGACDSELTACHADADCDALFTCVSACAANDNACQQNCGNAHPNGITLFNAIFHCSNCVACAAYCPQTQCGTATSTSTSSTSTSASTSSSSQTSNASGSGGASSTGTESTTGSGSDTGGKNAGGNGDGSSDATTQCGACAVARRDRENDTPFAFAVIGALGLALTMRRRASSGR